MKNKLLVISILLIIIIIVSYYWLRKQESSIEPYVNNTTKIYIHNLNENGTVNPILDSSNRKEMLKICTFNGTDIDIYIPEGIKEINGFFSDIILNDVKKNIITVSFPSTIKIIGVNEFKHCRKLNNIILPPGIEEIRGSAFRGTSITSVILPNIQNFKKDLYNHTNRNDINKWLSFIPFGVKNATVHSGSGAGFNRDYFKDKWVIVYNNEYYNQYTGGKNADYHLYTNKPVDNDTSSPKYMVKNYTKKDTQPLWKFPNRELNEKPDAYYSSIEDLKYPFQDNVDIIYKDNQSFVKQEYTHPNTTHIQNIEKYITDTENVKIATYRNVDDVHNIEGNDHRPGYLTVSKYATDRLYLNFYKDMKIINIVDGAVALGESLFNNNSYVETIIIPSSVKYIKDKCFKSCTKLKNVFFYPVSQLISIGNNAFQGCSNLNTIHLPDNLLTIGYKAFQGCSNLQVYINPSSKLKVVAMNAFDKTINKLVLPEQTHFSPIIHNEVNKISLRATTNMITSINDTTLQSRYISQSILEDSTNNFEDFNYESKIINHKDTNEPYYFFYFYPPNDKERMEYKDITFYSLTENKQIEAKILLVAGGGSGGGSNAWAWGAGGGGGGEVIQINTTINENDNIQMDIGHGARWNKSDGKDDCGNGSCKPNWGHTGASSKLTINRKITETIPGKGGGPGHWGKGGESGSKNGGGAGYQSPGGSGGGGGGGGGQTAAGKHNGNHGGVGGDGIKWIDNQGYGGGGGGGSWYTAGGGWNHFGGGTGGRWNAAGHGRKGSGGGGGGGSSHSPHQKAGDHRNIKRIGWISGRGGDGSCVFAFKKSDFDNGGWRLNLTGNKLLLSYDGQTVNGSSYNKQKTHDIYQNKFTNQVYIRIKDSPNYITEPLYYRYMFWEINENPENIPADDTSGRDPMYWPVRELEVWNQNGTRISHNSPDIYWSSRWDGGKYSPNGINNGGYKAFGNNWGMRIGHQTIKNVLGATSGKPRGFIGYDFKSPQHITNVKVSGIYSSWARTEQKNKRGYKLYFTNHIKKINNTYRTYYTPNEFTCVDPNKDYIVITSYDYNKTYKPFNVGNEQIRSFNHDIINTSNHTIQNSKKFITVPFPIDYYNTNKFSSNVLETQGQDILRKIKSIEEAEGIITTNIQIIREKIRQLDVTKLINDMNNAYGMDDLPSLTNFNAINSTINTYVSDVEAQFINVIIETNKEQFKLELATLEDDRDELQRQIDDALETNTARIEKRLQREADLATAEVTRQGEISKLKDSAGVEAEKATQTWYNQYKTKYDLDKLDETITNKDDSIKLYHQNVKDSTTLNLLDNSLNNLDEVYNRVNDQNMSTEIKRNMLDLELKNIGKETAAREKELQKLQEEDIKLKEETKQLKDRLKLTKLDQIISNNNMDLKHVNDTIQQQRLFTDNVKDLVQDKKNKLNILGHAYNTSDNVIQSQQQLIDDNMKTQEKYQIEKFTNLNKYNMKYMDPKYEDYRLNQEDCDQLLNEFDYDKYCEQAYYNINKDKCISKEICENRNNNNELENEMYINPGTRKRFKDNKDNYHYNYTNTINMSLGILTLFTIIYKIK